MTMSKLIRLKALVASWLAICALVAVLMSPVTLATALLLLMVALVVPGVVILLGRDEPPTVAEVLNNVERAPTAR